MSKKQNIIKLINDVSTLIKNYKEEHKQSFLNGDSNVSESLALKYVPAIESKKNELLSMLDSIIAAHEDSILNNQQKFMQDTGYQIGLNGFVESIKGGLVSKEAFNQVIGLYSLDIIALSRIRAELENMGNMTLLECMPNLDINAVKDKLGKLKTNIKNTLHNPIENINTKTFGEVSYVEMSMIGIYEYINNEFDDNLIPLAKDSQGNIIGAKEKQIKSRKFNQFTGKYIYEYWD